MNNAIGLCRLHIIEEVVEFAVGLRNEFKPLEGHDIGKFPGLGPWKKRNFKHVTLPFESLSRP